MGAPLKKLPRVNARGADLFIAVSTPAGLVFTAFSDRGVSLVHPAESGAQFATIFNTRTGRIVRQVDAADYPEIAEALTGGDGDTLDCDLEGVSPFTRRVLTAAAEIERGQTRSYQWLARQIGMPRAARAVGNALGSNPVPIIIPCHRVVRGDGSLGGYAFGQQMKRALLQAEGALPAFATA
jgi:methylated-DNA-[protein]-cysteine S-methyltransferase